MVELTGKVNALVAVWDSLSVVRTVKLAVAEEVGVPDSWPVVASSVMPVGNVPEATLQVIGLSPPLLVSVVLYGTLSEALGSVAVSTARMSETWRTKVLSGLSGSLPVVLPPLSARCRVKLKSPASVGVPERVAVAGLKVMPPGNAPPIWLQV